MSYPRLSALTDEVVDHLYGVDRASPVEIPTFLFLVGSPGAGKSSGHARAIDAGIIPAGNYVTVNLDTLLESLAPFQAASSMAHLLKQGPARNATKFSSLFAYGTRKENMGLFKWYNIGHEALEKEDPAAVAALNTVREHFRNLQDEEAPAKLMELNESAMGRAIRKGVHIVYETTLSLNKSGRVAKVDEIMAALAKAPVPYRVVFFHIRGDPAETAARIHARQEYGMPYEDPPYYRYVPTSVKATTEMIEKIAEAFAAVAKTYKGRATFEEFENPIDIFRLPPKRNFNANAQTRRIRNAFLGASLVRRSSTPPSSSSSRRSSKTSSAKSSKTSTAKSSNRPGGTRRRTTRRKSQ